MIEALGTLTPTSITVVATKTAVWPDDEAAPSPRLFPWRRHLPVNQAPQRPRPGPRAAGLEPLFGGGQIHAFRFPRPKDRPNRPCRPSATALSQAVRPLRPCAGSRPVAVVIGFRPGRFFVQDAETSMSPYCARLSDRGIGVAVITRDIRRARPSGRQGHPLRHAKPVLFVDHRQPQVLQTCTSA